MKSVPVDDAPEPAVRSEPADAPPSAGDMPVAELERLGHEVVDWMSGYLARLEEMPVFPAVAPGDVRSALPAHPPERGERLEEALADFRDVIVPGLTHWNHPAFFGYFAISGSGPGILGEMLAAALNVNAMVWRSSPAATELEEVATDWLRQLVGLPSAFDGVINDTASSSTLYALAAAREVAYPDAHRVGLFGEPRGRVYASDQAHSSVDKAVLALGLGREGVRRVNSDDGFRMEVDGLRAAIEEDRASSVRPVAVVATLGTTSTASIDPVADIADIAEEHGLWLHVDAAYGGPAAIVPELRPLFEGWERADSVVLNPHKWLFTPVDCSVLYCRRPEELRRAFSIVPEYLSSAERATAKDLMDYGLSLGRRFRALKLWLVLRYFGREGIVARLRDHVAMATELACAVDETPGWSLSVAPRLATVAFRYAPGWDVASEDRANRDILDRVNASGEAFLTHTVLGGRTTLRLSIGNIRSTRRHIERTWTLLQEAAASLPVDGLGSA